MDDTADSDSFSCYRETLKRSQQEAQAFYRQLDDYPHTFQLQDQALLEESNYRKVGACLESALSVGYQTSLETARARNALAFVYHKLGRPEEALKELDKVLKLQGQHNNLVTLANKAVILRQEHSLSRADEQVAKLLQIRKNNGNEFADLVTKAKAELAFVYTRLGPSFGHFAINLFEEAIPRVGYKDPGRCLWLFGVALTKRRRLRVLPNAGVPPEGEMLTDYREVLGRFLDLQEHVASPTFRAKIYAEIALVLHMVCKSEPARREFAEMSGLTAEEACDIALRLDDNDNSVLCKCGRIYRYIRKHTRSLELLEKSLSIRPSSTSYHHLGITYKLLATEEKRKYQHRLTSRSGGGRTDYQDLVKRIGNNPEAALMGETHQASPPLRPLSPTKEVRNMQLAVKSPPAHVTSFTREDKYVAKAVENLERAVTFGEGLNHRAVLDLAIMQRTLGELEKARANLQQLLRRQPPECASDHVTIYDQLGSVLREMADVETDKAREEELRKDSSSMHLMALKLASKLLGKVPGIIDHVSEIWDAFQSLSRDVDNSGRSAHEKLQEKAVLLQLIRSNKQSIDLLKEIQNMDPNKVNDPKYLKLYIENYVAMKQYEKALTFVELLAWSAQRDRVIQLFEDHHFLPKVYIQAAREALLQGSVKAKDHFKTVFQEMVAVDNDATSGSEDTSDAASEADSRASENVSWDLFLLHEEEVSSREVAVALAKLLQNLCGLKVPILDRDQPVNKLDAEGVLRMMRRSVMVVVLAGHRKVSKEFRYLISNAIHRQSTVTLLVEGAHVPEMLSKAHRSLVCPPQLFQVMDNPEEGHCTTDPSVPDAVCSLFCFLLNITMPDKPSKPKVTV